MNWDAIEAAGRAVNQQRGPAYKDLQQSVRDAATAATAVAQPIVRGPNDGRFTGLGIQAFQQQLFAKNVSWRFTDRTLCVLWKLEFPDARADFISDCRRYVGGTRSAINRGRHGGGNHAPAEPFIEYDEHGLPSRGSRATSSAPSVAAQGATGLASARWDAFIRWASLFRAAPDFDIAEYSWKVELGTRLNRVADAARANEPSWFKLLKSAFGSPNNLTSFYAHGAWLDWWNSHQDLAQRALLDLWDSADTARNRVQAFLQTVPTDLHGGPGVRLNIASYLLMGAGATTFPVYASRVFEKGLDLTGFPAPPAGSDEGQTYEHALSFLDRIVEEARARGLTLRDRLEAQAVLFCVVKYDAPAHWSERDRTDFNRYRGMAVSEPQAESAIDSLARELLLDAAFLHDMERLLRHKKQIVFYGPPGTGKTYVAQRLARCLVGDSGGSVQLVQFHPSYAYEDFVEGFRPAVSASGQPGFELRDGPLKRIARLAEEDENATHVLIIDELNRGNIAKVFGELYFLLEYRDDEIFLQYSNAPFKLPKNLLVIATMNTADRSIALVDAALRRRFYFQGFFPDQPPIKGLLDRWLARERPGLGWVSDVVNRANARLRDRNAAIGPSHFLRKDLSEAWVERIWAHSVLPTIEEHFFGETERLRDFELSRLRGSTGDEPGTDADVPAPMSFLSLTELGQ